MHTYATTTPKARELVSELEFVWDQIKSNSASSTDSSPGHMGRSQGRQLTNPSYASIGHDKRRGSDGLRVLRPVSDDDEENSDLEDEDLQESPLGAYDDEAAVAGVPPPPRDFDIRNHKWRKRIDRALLTLTTEVAALREQIEAKRITERKMRNGIWAWMVWLVWVAVQHALVNLAILGRMVV